MASYALQRQGAASDRFDCGIYWAGLSVGLRSHPDLEAIGVVEVVGLKV